MPRPALPVVLFCLGLLTTATVAAAAPAIWAPAKVGVAPTNECSAVARDDGSLEIYSITKPASDSVSVIRSLDNGATWSPPQIAFPLPGRAYYAVQVLADGDGGLQAVFHLAGEGPGGYRGKLYEVYHTARRRGAATWTEPKKIVPGYVGSIRGFIRLKQSGRLGLAVGRAVPAREAAPKSGPDLGWNDTFVYFSDDRGATWRQSPEVLSVELRTPNTTRYGAIEPALLELADGRVWMLGRDRGGHLWQSRSADGERWSTPEVTPFISSDSPASLLRLGDGRIVLFTNACQNWSNPRSYAMGGREVLHAAISADDGKTWRGFREVLRETELASRGDRGTAYASAMEAANRKIVFVSGQGEGQRAIVTFDPNWLEEREVHDDLSAGPIGWTQFGRTGLSAAEDEAHRPVVALNLASSPPAGAAWNFPAATTGEVTFRLQLPTDTRGLRVALTDHFSRMDDSAAASHAAFALGGETAYVPADARFHQVALKWRGVQAQGELRVEVDGKLVSTIPASRSAPLGLNYLRFELASGASPGAVLIGDLAARQP